MFMLKSKHKAEIERLQAKIEELEAPFRAANKILAKRGIYRDSKGRFACAETLYFNKAIKAVKNGN